MTLPPSSTCLSIHTVSKLAFFEFFLPPNLNHLFIAPSTWPISGIIHPRSIKLSLASEETRLNLSLAIPYIRHDSDDVVLWADALCVNQNDIQERSDQVGRMGSVYNGAKEVMAWLGEEDDSTEIAMELVESWATLMDISEKFEGVEYQPRRAAMLGQIQRLLPMAFDSRANLALLALAEKPYGSRAWIYQELSLAKNAVIQSGRVSKSLDCFLGAFQGLQILYSLSLVDARPTDIVAIGDITTRPSLE